MWQECGLIASPRFACDDTFEAEHLAAASWRWRWYLKREDKRSGTGC